MRGHFNIAAVAELTGIPAETLRTWERRYGVVNPERTPGGQRRYSNEEVDRLCLIAQLVESGSRISTLAKLELAELRQRLELSQDQPRPVHGDIRVLWIGSTPLRLDGSTGSGVRVQVTQTISDRSELPHPNDEVDLVVIGLDALGPTPKDAVLDLQSKLNDARVVVTYAFLPSARRAELELPGVRVLRTPLPSAEFRQVLADFFLADSGARSLGRGAASEPRFSLEQLRALAEQSASLQCECPNHIASLVTSLVAFEEYSRRCVSESPEDETVHRTLEEGTGWARLQMEDLLDLVLKHDGIEVPT
ncbi:MAG: MerR family transcriptional regulator [Myxococcota bacterium]